MMLPFALAAGAHRGTHLGWTCGAAPVSFLEGVYTGTRLDDILNPEPMLGGEFS
jgi:hypothetical protein